MRLATIDPHSHKVQTKLHKIPSSLSIRLVLTEIEPFENVKIYKEMYGHPDSLTQRLDAIHFFVSFDVFKLLCLSQN